MPVSPSPSKRLGLYLVVAAGAVVVAVLFVYGCRAFDAGAGPGVVAFRKEVFSLRPDQVQSANLERVEEASPSSSEHSGSQRRELSRAEIATFLTLVAQAKAHQPNHPETRWLYTVRMSLVPGTATAEAKVIEFQIRDSSNNGTYLQLWSQGTHGTNYGAFRNDALGPFLEGVFRRGPE